jgi:phosphate transport system substrate-binding protein
MKRNSAHIIPILIVAATVLTACAQKPQTTAPSELKGTIIISGAFALYPMMTIWTQEFQKTNTSVTFDLSAGGAGKGMTDVLTGMVDIGMISRPITTDEESKGAYWVAITKDAVFPVINSHNPVIAEIMSKGITQEVFTKIFVTGEISTWGQVVGKPEISSEIHVYTRSDACGAGDIWAKFLGNFVQGDIIGIGVNGDPAELDAVVKDPLGIGFNNLGYVFDLSSGNLVDGILAAPIDNNKNGLADQDELVGTLSKAVELITTKKYPSPPGRIEYLATKGKPSGITQVFIEWILTDGQKFVGSSGYVPLTTDELNESLAKVK